MTGPPRRISPPPAGGGRAPKPAMVTITSIAAGGDGVARVGNLVVFIPRTAPHDVVEIDFVGAGRLARGTLRAIRTPSPQRVAPACIHYNRDACGGCQLQHMSYDAQRTAKARIVADALLRIGHREVAVPEVRASPSQWRYRRKLTLALRRRGAEWYAGLHPHDVPARVFELTECRITDERVLAAWRDVMAAAAELPEATELRGAVRVDDSGASFTLEGGKAWPRAEAFFARTPTFGSLWWTPEGGVRRRLAERGGGENAPGASFVQVNVAVAEELQSYVLRKAMSHLPRTIVDAYAGTGALALAAALRKVRVTAVELDEDAVAWCAARLPADSRAIAATVEDVLSRVLPADVVVLNPPRAGVDAKVTTLLAGAAPTTKAIVYVSCDPATLARDLTRLPAWRIASLTCFDMFPQTAHVETVCELVPGAP